MRDVYTPLEPVSDFGYDGSKPVPCDPVNQQLAESLFRLIDSKNQLEKAIAAVPSYTGQWDAADYYANALESYNRCVDAFGDAVKATRGEIAV